ncbi:MAG: hypothetical protein NTW26_08565, partial [bacterium]|nr:hypothetical protein [bacterium]
MTRNLALVLALLAGVSAMQAATIEYQGPSGNLAVAGNWYIITDAGNPASRTGATRLPQAYTGTYPTGTLGDTAIIRNGTTTTLNSLLSSQNLLIGGPQITGQATGPGTTVYVTSGGTMSLYSDDPSFEDPPENPLRFRIGEYYGGTMTMDGGLVNVNGRRGGGLTVGASPVAAGVVNISGGTINVVRPFTTGATFNMGNGVGATGVINQSGGLVRINGALPPNGPSSDKVGRIGVGGYGEYNLSGGQFVTRDWFNIGQEYVDDDSNRFPGTGVMSITGGTWEYGYRVGVGDGRFGDANVGHLRIMAGTLKVAADTVPHDNGHIWLGRGDPTTGAVVNS